MAYRDQNKGIARGNWSLEFKRRYNQENPDKAVCEEHGCGKTAEGQFVIPDYYETFGGDIDIWQCKDHARGTWCLGCGSFIGGTEDVFRYPDYECSHCVGWVASEIGDEFPSYGHWANEVSDAMEYDEYEELYMTDQPKHDGFNDEVARHLTPYMPDDDDLPF